MPAPVLKHLFSPLRIRGKTIKNRILSTGHDTTLITTGVPNDALVAYHQARAKGGAGLIIVQASGVHDSARYTSHVLMATDDACIPGFRRIAEVCHAEGCTVFGQLFHPGREIMESQDGSAPVAYAPSAVPNERFHVMPKPMSKRMIREVIEGYGQAAVRLKTAGLDGVEVVRAEDRLRAQAGPVWLLEFSTDVADPLEGTLARYGLSRVGACRDVPTEYGMLRLCPLQRDPAPRICPASRPAAGR